MLPEFESWLGPYERANAYNSLWLSFLIGKKKKKKKNQLRLVLPQSLPVRMK